MVVILAPAKNKICEPFTYKYLTRSQGKPTFLSLMVMHKECIENMNTSKFESILDEGSTASRESPWTNNNIHPLPNFVHLSII